MIISRLEMENIRSYRRVSIDFPLGKTLFEGDIGSGKSTILMAIEFALFGFGTESGASLLRLDSPEGSVRMTFSTDEGEYVVERGLTRKGRGVQQTNGVLRTPEGDLNLSPSELKERILGVLGFNEVPDPRAQSWIYRYAVYTPQEQMKSVLELPADLRLQVLRRAFGVEDYKAATENSTNLVREIRRKAAEFEVLSRGVQELKSKLAELQGRREADAAQVSEAQSRLGATEGELGRLKREKEELHEREVQLRNSEETIRLLKEKAADMLRAADDEKETTKELSRRVESLRKRADELGRPKAPSSLSTAELEANADSARGKAERLAKLEAKLDSKLDEYKSILEKGKCPVCDRKVDAQHFKDKAKARRAERRHVASELAAERRKEREFRNQARAVREYELESREASEVRAELNRCSADLKRSVQKAERAEGEARAANFQIETLEKKVASLVPFTRRADEIGQGIENAERTIVAQRDSLSRMTEGIELSKTREAEIREEIGRKEEARRRSDSLQEYALWISDYFVPALQLMERSVLLSLNQEFDSLFRKWYSDLVDDPGKEARVDDDFTPVITQDGYDQDFRYLSGGERTSISLAYRLALNSLVQRVSAAKSNILILDEPTDGFSKEQLGSVREVLDDVGCQQVIVVSHEKELESFADQIFRVVKESGESAVLSGN